MSATYYQRGEAIDYKNTSALLIKAGDVVSLNTRIGVAGCNIEPDATGSVHVTGVFLFPKATTTAMAIGNAVEYDTATDSVIASTGSGLLAGWVIEPAATTDETVKIKIG